ncbi:MAG: hypothetical protein ACM3ML_39000 [Micromonosporaceae bacterium]
MRRKKNALIKPARPPAMEPRNGLEVWYDQWNKPAIEVRVMPDSGRRPRALTHVSAAPAPYLAVCATTRRSQQWTC